MHLSQVTRYFTSYVDLQEIVTEASSTNTPGMKDTLLALGFFRDDLDVRGMCEHSARNDAVRELAILVGLLYLSKGSKLHIQVKRHE